MKLHAVTEGRNSVHPIEVPENPNKQDLIAAMVRSGQPGEIEEILVFTDESEDQLGETVVLESETIIVCHRCREIGVEVTYNGRTIKKHFAPSTKSKKVFAWSIKEFGIDHAEALHHELLDGSDKGKPLQPTQRIGTLVHYPKCELPLWLVKDVNILG